VEKVADPTGCGWWTYTNYDGEDGKRTTVVYAYQVGNQHQPGALAASQQKYRIQYQDERLRTYILDPHRQTMIDLEYFSKPLQAKCHDIALFIDTNEGIEQRFQPQGQKVAFKTDHGFHVDGRIDRYLRTFMENYGLVNIIAEMHGLDLPKTHIRGSKQIDSALFTPRLAEFVKYCGLLDIDTLCRSDHRRNFLDLAIKGVFCMPPEHLPLAQFCKLRLDDPRISDAYRCALHKQFEQHNVYRKVKKISIRSESAEWKITDEAKYEGVERYIGSAMDHAQSVCSTSKLHTTAWSKSIGRATHDIGYWYIRIKKKGCRDLNDGVLNYYLVQSNIDVEAFDKILPMSECHRQAKNDRAKLNDVFTDAKENETDYEVEVAIERVHKRYPELFDDLSLEEEREDRVAK
jgi:hypothetical protein